MFKPKFASIIQNNFFYIVLLANFLFTFIKSYYIFPFKLLRPDISTLSSELPESSKEELYLSYLNLATIYTLIKPKNSNSEIYELIFKVSEKCSFQSNQSCISNYDTNIFDNNNHKNENILNVINTILDTNPKEQCTNIKIGLAMPGFQGKDKCVFIADEIKRNDKSVNSTSYSFKFYGEKESKEKGYDGELIMGVELHNIEPSVYKEDELITVYNHVNDYYYNYDLWDGKYVNFSFIFGKVYFYVDNIKNEENYRYIKSTESVEGAIDFEIGLNKCPFTFYALIKLIFFDDYLKSNICKETTLWGGYFGILCDKKKLNVKTFYEKFPTLYFDNINLNYTFILDSNDLFIENDDTIYFTLISRNEKLNNWRFGQLFLKKYRLVFNHDKKSIGCYIKREKKEGNNGEEQEKGKKLSIGIIILIIGIALLIVEGIAAFICIKKCNYCSNRKKRANELLDDNYDYSAVIKPDEDKAIN